MENKYLDEGWNNRPDHSVYGFRLRPFCLYYLHLLQSIGSPLIQAGKAFGPSHLLMAAEICSSPWSDEGYTLDRILRPGPLRLKRNQAKLMLRRFRIQNQNWHQYYEDFIAVAEKWEDSGEKYDEFGTVVGYHKTMGRTDLDRVMATATAIIYASGWSEEYVMMMPIGRAFGWADYFSIKEGNKDLKFVTEKDDEIRRRTDAAIKAMEEKEAHAQSAPK